MWRLAKNFFQLKEKDKATFFSHTDEWSLPAASTIKPEERKFVVDSRASMHVVSRKDPNSAELETVRVSKSPTTLVTANGECQFYKSESGCKLGKECSFPHWKVEEQTNQRPKKGGDQRAVAFVTDVRQLGCVSQDVEPPESVTISRTGTKVLGRIRRVRFTRAALRQANIRENKGPSLTSSVKSLRFEI